MLLRRLHLTQRLYKKNTEFSLGASYLAMAKTRRSVATSSAVAVEVHASKKIKLDTGAATVQVVSTEDISGIYASE